VWDSGKHGIGGRKIEGWFMAKEKDGHILDKDFEEEFTNRGRWRNIRIPHIDF
jgi:hypothetical protein